MVPSCIAHRPPLMQLYQLTRKLTRPNCHLGVKMTDETLRNLFRYFFFSFEKKKQTFHMNFMTAVLTVFRWLRGLMQLNFTESRNCEHNVTMRIYGHRGKKIISDGEKLFYLLFYELSTWTLLVNFGGKNFILN